MTVEDINKMLTAFGIPYSYYHYMADGIPQTPYMIYAFPSETTEDADDYGYGLTVTMVIRLYLREKNFGVEKHIRDIFRQYELPYTKNEDYIDGENVFIEEYTLSFYLEDDE